MDFALTETRQMLQDTLRRFLAENYATETRNAIVESETGFSPEIWAQLAELGIIGALFAEDDGGFGGDGFDLAVVFEELGRAGVVEPFTDTGVLAGGLLATLGSDTQKAHLEGVISGQTQLAFAHGEPQSRYDLNHVETRATEASYSYTLSGHKSVVINGGNADYVIVSARTSGGASDEDGISLFLLPTDAQGLDIRTYPSIDGAQAAELVLRDCVAELLGEKDNAHGAIEYHAARTCAALCAEALGAMEKAKDLTVDYLKTREQFGRPIGKFQALQHRMADMLIEIEQVRSAVINLCGHLESDRIERERNVSATKNLVGRVGRLVAEETIQMHGGIAMTREYELAHIAKRMVMVDHRFGDTDHHLQRFIAFTKDAP
ncbi:MAG: acyl-CoA dehydrogenase family protein [Hyphomicrobiales bacterium]